MWAALGKPVWDGKSRARGSGKPLSLLEQKGQRRDTRERFEKGNDQYCGFQKSLMASSRQPSGEGGREINILTSFSTCHLPEPLVGKIQQEAKGRGAHK